MPRLRLIKNKHPEDDASSNVLEDQATGTFGSWTFLPREKPYVTLDPLKEAQDPVSMYQAELRQYSLPTDEELAYYAPLLKEPKDSDQYHRAREFYLKSHLRLVCSVAKGYIRKAVWAGMTYGDLISEGNKGLLRAIEKYDPDKGFKLTTYAPWWIRQAVARAIQNNKGARRIPIHLHYKYNRVQKGLVHLRTALGREPTLKEASESLGIPQRNLEFILNEFTSPLSLEIIKEDRDTNILNYLKSPDPNYERFAAHAKLLEIINTRPCKERLIIKYRFGFLGGEGLSLERIGEKLGVSRERIRQIEAKTLKKLQNPKISRMLEALYE